MALCKRLLRSCGLPYTVCEHIQRSLLSFRYIAQYHSTSHVSGGGVCQSNQDVARDHIPVMVEEVVQLLKPQNGQVFLDMTFGAGGHTLAILDQAPSARMFCLDRDPVAHDKACHLSESVPQVTPLLGKFTDVAGLLHPYGCGENSLDGVLFDVGASSMQFDDPLRGFSISQDGPLDMRMDRGHSDKVTAEDVVNCLDESSLYKILKKYGEEKNARNIARTIVDSRYAFGRIKTTKQLATVVASAFEGSSKRDKLFRHAHVATKTFQALRIFVNNELNELHNGLSFVNRLLKPGGCCVAITFHSLEDRIVKRHFRGIDMDAKMNMSSRDQVRMKRGILEQKTMQQLLSKKWQPVIKGLLQPSEEEVERNPRARSAKLRAATKL